MSDIASIWNISTGQADWAVSPLHVALFVDEHGASILDQHGNPILDGANTFVAGTGLLAGNDLVTAALISLFTDAAAGVDDVIPDGTTDPRGWWADASIGSKIWLRLRSKKTDTLIALVKDDIATALTWMVTDGVASAIDVTAEWTSPSMLGTQVVIRRHAGNDATLKVDWAWKDY